MCVLIAEDDPDQLAVRRLLLERLGFEVISASTCQEALQAALTAKPACAVLDLRLPDQKSGLRLIRGLKRADSGMFVIVLTGADLNSFEGTPERTMVDAVFTKGNASSAWVARIKAFAAR